MGAIAQPVPLGQDISLPLPIVNSAVNEALVTQSIVTGPLTQTGVLTRQKTGAAPTVGSAVLVAGTVTVPTTAVTANSIIFLSFKTLGGTTGTLSVGTITAGTSFVINSSNVADTGTVNWQIIEGV